MSYGERLPYEDMAKADKDRHQKDKDRQQKDKDQDVMEQSPEDGSNPDASSSDGPHHKYGAFEYGVLDCLMNVPGPTLHGEERAGVSSDMYVRGVLSRQIGPFLFLPSSQFYHGS